MTYLSPEIVELAKECGFDEKPLWQSTGKAEDMTLSATYGITLQQVEEFLFEKYGIYFEQIKLLGQDNFIISFFGRNGFIAEGNNSNPFAARENGCKQTLEDLAKNKV